MAAAKAKKAHRAAKQKSGAQQSLFRRGGRRRGAGRKSSKARPGRRHERRADFSARHPLHVVLRVDEAVRTLRRRAMYKAIREATISAAQHQRIRITHISLQRVHIHMIVEAADRDLLARGLQGFQISAARNINRALGRENTREATWVLKSSPRNIARAQCNLSTGSIVEVEHNEPTGRGARTPRRRGRVFTDRYYVEIITTPTQALNAISYVLNNFRHHGEDRGAQSSTWLVDPFSSGHQFPHWRERVNQETTAPPTDVVDVPFANDVPLAEDAPLAVCAPQTWLLSEGWKRVGSISAWTVPGTKHRRQA